MSLAEKMSAAVSILPRIVLYNRFVFYMASSLLSLAKVMPKDLVRPYPARCPACISNDVVHSFTVPYYKTHLMHWGSTLSLYRKIVDRHFRLVRFDLNRCRSCGLTFVPESYRGLVEEVEKDPLFFDKVVEPYLNLTQPLVTSLTASEIISLPAENLTLIESTFKKLFSVIINYRKEITKYLDFGSNMGAFAEFVRIAMPDSDVTCCEINQHYALKCRERYPLLKIIDRPLTSESQKNTFDFIYCSDVIEHIWNLDEIISVFRSHLREHGLLMLVTPNSDSQNAKGKGTRWWSYCPSSRSIF